MTDFVERADRALDAAYDEPMPLGEYVARVLENPDAAAHASRYLLSAIEAEGTRTVVEQGEELERYRFFDDPHNDGEHAILGNTRTLNAFVDDLRAAAAGRGKSEKILWFAGPTATGKSELKRCLVNGLREYSKTPEGRRYTVEWNISGAEDSPGLTYGDEGTPSDEDWYESPVQANPLSVFPEDVREDILATANEHRDDTERVRLESRLDPFSREAYDYLEEEYRRRGQADVFSAVTDDKHLRVKNYVMDVGQGIGVLHSEDAGSPKERLVGSWIAPLLAQLDSRGRKNPQAFSYDGVLSQGNGGLTVVEDASQHADLLQKLLNVPDEKHVKLDKGVGMDVDTQMIVISNLDLEAQLNQHDDKQGFDPLKALKRRLSKHQFGYLTSVSLEAELLRRELAGEARVPDNPDDRLTDPLTISVKSQQGTQDREFAPHAIEAAAMYSVVTRLDGGDLPDELSFVEKAQLFDRGWIRRDGERVEIDAFDLDANAADGGNGIPVTYTRDILADIVHEDSDRRHPDLPVEQVVLPEDVLDALVDGLADAPLFSGAERSEFEDRLDTVREYVRDRQAEDVIEALLADERADESQVREYVEHVHAWATDTQLENDRGEDVDPDPLLMRVFETETLGRFDVPEYDGNQPGPEVREFRNDTIMPALSRHAWENRNEAFQATDVDLSSIPVIRDVLAASDWNDVKRVHEDLDPRQWADPPSNTETARLKDRTLDYLVEEHDYSRAAAELASRTVMREVAPAWD